MPRRYAALALAESIRLAKEGEHSSHPPMHLRLFRQAERKSMPQLLIPRRFGTPLP
jgi:hypothetical protein